MGGGVTGSLSTGMRSTASRLFGTPSQPTMAAPAGTVISKPGKRSSLNTWSSGAFCLSGLKCSAAAGGLMTQSAAVVICPAGRSIRNGHMG
jgi:hypothetical protein